MNERIKGLVKQATTEEHDGFLYFDKQKFAELIIRECADFLDDFNYENMVEEGMDGAYMKKHFGIE